MLLKQKLNAMTPMNTVEELTKMISHVKISLSYAAVCIVNIQGYDDSINFNEFADILLKADEFDVNKTRSIEARLAGDDVLWKFYDLHKEAERLINDCSFLYKNLVIARDYFSKQEVSTFQEIIRQGNFPCLRETLFEFTPQEYRALFDDVEPISERILDNGVRLYGTTRHKLEEIVNPGQYNKNACYLLA